MAVRLGGSRVLLTGASGGLGGTLARRLAAAGAKLVLTGRRAEVLEELARELGARATIPGARRCASATGARRLTSSARST